MGSGEYILPREENSRKNVHSKRKKGEKKRKKGEKKKGKKTRKKGRKKKIGKEKKGKKREIKREREKITCGAKNFPLRGRKFTVGIKGGRGKNSTSSKNILPCLCVCDTLPESLCKKGGTRIYRVTNKN